MAAYCTTSDLLTGNIPLPTYVDSQRYVDDAADEIDSKIGFVYETPIDTGNTLIPRPAILLLKRINYMLATGRLLMAIDAGGEETQVHAYGLSLVREATAALDQIASGAIVIENAPTIDTGADARVTAIIVNNLDATSQVEDFYEQFMTPTYPPYASYESERLLRDV